MAADAMRITDGQSHCRIPDPTSGTIEAPLLEIGLQGALVKTALELEENAYIDVTLVMRDQAPKQLFAHVVKCSADGMRLRWLHFDPGEEGKLKGVLEIYAKAMAGNAGSNSSSRRKIQPTGDAPPLTSTQGNSGTRRLVRPTASAITPFSDADSSAPAGDTSGNERISVSGRKGTRRVVRPSQQAMTPFGDDGADGISATPGEESRTQQVVIEPTERFDKLTDVRIEEAQAKKKAAAQSGALDQTGLVHTPFAGNAVVGAPVAPSAPKAEKTAPAQTPTHAPTNTPSGGSPFPDDSGSHKVAGPKTTVIGKDGRMDIGASIRTHAKTIRASELAARHDKVRVLNMATIKGLIQEAVEEAASHLTRSLGEAERKHLLEEAEESFQERLKEFQAEKQSSEERNKRLNDQLESARKLLEDERARAIKADQFTVSAEGLGEIEERFERFLARTLSAGKVPPDVEEELRAVISRILDSEREKIRERELEAQNSKIELLERKIGRLAGSLDESERQRDEAQRFAAFLESQGGGALRNVYTAGLKGEDPNKEKKLALMKNILEENRLLRQSLGIELAKVDHVAEAKKSPAPTASPAAPAPAATLPAADVSADADDAAEETAADEDTSDSDDVSGAEPEGNPDDEIWEVKPLENITQGVNEHGVKRMDVSAVLDKGPPPLEKR